MADDGIISAVDPVAAWTYNGDGTQRSSGFPVYHGYYSSAHGAQRGFVWLPPLEEPKECLQVQVLWSATHLYAADLGLISFGYHELPQPTVSIDYSDGRIYQHAFEVEMSPGQAKWIDMPSLVPLVNDHRGGGFGFLVGHWAQSQEYYGYGYPQEVSYRWLDASVPPSGPTGLSRWRVWDGDSWLSADFALRVGAGDPASMVQAGSVKTWDGEAWIG